MYCSKCGTELPKNVKFCSKCGNSISSPKAQVSNAEPDNGDPTLVLKPRFLGLVSMLSFTAGSSFVVLQSLGSVVIFGGMAIIGVLFSITSSFSGGSLFTHSSVILGSVIFGVLFYAVPIYLYYYQLKKTYAKTEYRFFKDRIEYSEGFWTTNEHSIKFDQITNVSMNKNIIQKKYGIGTLHLVTASGQGISIKDVEEPEKVYKVAQFLVSGQSA